MDNEGDRAQAQTQVETKLSAMAIKGGSQRRDSHPLGYDARGFINLNMLADAKRGVKCELCENAGILMCEPCRVTYYCSVRHFLLDKEFHSGLCSKVKLLRQPLEFSPMHETRERWKKQRRLFMEELYLYSLRTSQSHLDQSQFRAAVPAATVATNYAKTLYGESEEMILPMLVAAEAHLRLGNVSMAEGFVARAMSIELNKPNIRPSIKAKIRHNEGIVAMVKDDLQEALVNFAEEVYQTSEEYGPNHRRTAMGYCNLGRLFHMTEEFATSNSLFKQVSDIWTTYLEPILRQMTSESETDLLKISMIKNRHWIAENDKFEAEDVLMHCYNHQKQCLLPPVKPLVTPADLARTCYAISVLNYIAKRIPDADKMVSEAFVHLGDQAQEKEPRLVKKLLFVQKHVFRKAAHLETERLEQDHSNTSFTMQET